MKKQLVLIGGGHAHMLTLSRLDTFIEEGWQVTVIQPSDNHYYSGMGPGMLGQTYQASDIRFDTRRLVEELGGVFVLDYATKIDPVKQLVFCKERSEPLPYDLLSCNCGSYVPLQNIQVSDSQIFTAKPIEMLLVAQKKLLHLSQQKKVIVGIVGGGPSAVEFAGNVEQLCLQNGLFPPEITLYCRSLLSGLPKGVATQTRKLLEQKGVRIVEGARCSSVVSNRIDLDNGDSYNCDVIFAAFGVKPSKIFVDSSLPVGDDGGLLVGEQLQSVEYDTIFGGGDCIAYKPQSLDKVGVYAVRQNEILYDNLMASIKGTSLRSFEPGGSYLQILNLGRGTGVLTKWGLVFSGKLAFKLKDSIDRKFIEKFR